MTENPLDEAGDLIAMMSPDGWTPASNSNLLDAIRELHKALVEMDRRLAAVEDVSRNTEAE